MKTTSYLFLLLLILLLTMSGFAQTNPTRIKAIRAQLFYEATGKFSEDLFSQKELSLWNTVIGEGSSGGASSSTLVTVEVTGKNVPIGSTKVEVTATDDKNRQLGKKVIEVSIYDARTIFYAPFWLYDTGCIPIKLSARLIGKGANAVIVRKTIPFACGE